MLEEIKRRKINIVVPMTSSARSHPLKQQKELATMWMRKTSYPCVSYRHDYYLKTATLVAVTITNRMYDASVQKFYVVVRNQSFLAEQDALQPTRFSWLAHCTQSTTNSTI